jgi:thymidine kinase
MRVWLIKPSTDKRDGDDVIKSRMGLSAVCTVIGRDTDVFELFLSEHSDSNVIIADECQFFSKKQIDEMRRIVNERNVPTLCFGLRTDFLTNLFPGSRRLFEIADEITEIKTMCECGAKATVSARIGTDGRVVTEGRQIFLGGNDKYVAMCHKCYVKRIAQEKD